MKVFFEDEMTSSAEDAGGMEKEWFNVICQTFIDSKAGNFYKI